jgi:hypothetical protein
VCCKRCLSIVINIKIKKDYVLLSLFYDLEEGRDTFLRNILPYTNYTTLRLKTHTLNSNIFAKKNVKD